MVGVGQPNSLEEVVVMVTWGEEEVVVEEGARNILGSNCMASILITTGLVQLERALTLLIAIT